MKIVAAIILILLIIPALFLLGSLVVMLLSNIVLGHYGIETLDFTASMATFGLSMLLFGPRVSSSK